MSKVSPLLFAVLMSACSSSDGSGEGSQAILPPVFQLTKGDNSILVFDKGAWDMQDTTRCAKADGRIDDAELKKLRGYVGDASLNLGAHECSDQQFELTVMMDKKKVACWDEPKSDASKALTAFFQERATQLADKPAGECSGNAVAIEPPTTRTKNTDPPPPTSHAGSGG